MKKDDFLLNMFIIAMLTTFIFAAVKNCKTIDPQVHPEFYIPIRCMDDGYLYKVVDDRLIPVYENNLKKPKKCKKI